MDGRRSTPFNRFGKLWLALAAAALALTGCAPTGAHLQAHNDVLATQQLRHLSSSAPGLRLPDPLQATLQALQEEARSDQEGMASWYGPGFHGRRTASGERFNTAQLTAAHPSYAFGTRLCVVSQKDGKSVEVRVNDRGPYAKNRIIDLSKAAAQALGMLDSGVRKVQLWKLDGEDSCADRGEMLATAE